MDLVVCSFLLIWIIIRLVCRVASRSRGAYCTHRHVEDYVLTNACGAVASSVVRSNPTLDTPFACAEDASASGTVIRYEIVVFSVILLANGA